MSLHLPSCKNQKESGFTDSCNVTPTYNFSNELNWKFEYDDFGRLIKSVDPGGKLTELVYEFSDAANQILKSLIRKNADGSVIYSFDHFGRLTSMQDAAGTVIYEYDGFSRVTAVKRNNEQSIAYTYNALDQLTSYSIDNTFKVEYVYDFLGRIKTMKTPVGNISYEYRTGQSTVMRTLPNQISTYWKFKPDGKLESIEHVSRDNSLLCKYAYKYGADGLIAEVNEWTPKGTKVLKYGYDIVKRLVSYETSNNEKTTYTYDSIGNRTSVTTNGVVEERTEYDGVGKMLTCNGQQCSYDASGNLTSYSNAGKAASYKYDAANKLKEANGVVYEYDGAGNLISRRFNNQLSIFYPDPFSEIWKPLSANDDAKKSFYIWEGEHPIAVVENLKVYFFLEDNLASVRSIVNMQGMPSKFLSFSPFGIPGNANGSSALVPSFTGLFFDEQANLFLTRARAYAPNTGRFLQIDPLHHIPTGVQKDLSAYAYCGGDPINFLDAKGTQSHFNSNWTWWSSYFSTLFDAKSAKQYYADRSAQSINSATNPWIGGFAATGLDLIGGFIPGEGGNTGQNIASIIWSIAPWSKASLILKGVGIGRTFTSSLINSSQGNLVNAFLDIVSLHGSSLALQANAIRSSKAMSLYIYGNALKLEKTSQFLGNIGRIKTGWNASGTLGLLQRIDDFLVPPVYGDEISPSDISPSNVGGIYLGGAGKNLEGLNNISGIAVDKATGRIVLLGKGDKEVAVPPLRLDDVVTIFKSVYNCEAPYVSIDPNPENPNGSIMLTRHSETTINTYVGWILFQTDRIMKAYSLSKDNETQHPVTSHVQGYQDVLDAGFVGNEYGRNIWTRFWIVPGDVKQSVSTGDNVSLFDMTLKVNTQQMKMQGGKLVPADNDAPNHASQLFADWFTHNYDAIADEAMCAPPAGSGINGNIAVFKELRRIALITAIAENLRDNGVPFPFWMRDYKVKPLITPVTTPAITVETRSNQMIHKVYGGVDLSIPKGRTTIITNDPVANSVSAKVAGLATKPFIEPLQLSIQSNGRTVANTAIALPGAETKALAPCKLTETDLQVPLKHGGFISLERHYNSFFNPIDIFGDVWTLNLPKLEQQKMPFNRTEASVQFNIQHNLITPLNSINATAIKVYEGRNTNIGYKTSMVILPDNRRLHFDGQRNLVGIENAGFTTVYKRDKNGRVETIKGYSYRNAEAHINLTYSNAGKLTKAVGSNDVYADYIYDDEGNLLRIEKQFKDKSIVSLKYAYGDKKVEQVLMNDKPVKQFTYNSQVQLLKEMDANKGMVNYQINVTENGYKFVSSEGNRSTVVEYNAAYMPTHVELADRSFINWTYNADHSVNILLQTPAGQQYKIVYSADGKNRSMQLPEGGVMESELDDNGRLLKLKRNGEVILQQVWQPDGALASIQYGNTIAHNEYNQQGEPVRTIIGLKGAGNSFSEWVEEVYDKNGNVVKQRDYSGKDISYEYSDGEVSGIVINTNAVSISRKSDGRVKKIKTSWGTQNISYDGDDVEKIEMDFGKSIDNIHFQKGLPVKIYQSDGGKYQFAYSDNPKGKLLCGIKAPNELQFHYKYDSENRLSFVGVGEQYRIEYGRDGKGRVSEIKFKYR